MKKQFIRNNIIAFLAHIMTYLKGIILMPIIIKTVGVSVYGSFILITSVIGVLFALSSLGVGVKSQRYLPSATTSDQKAKLFYPPFFFQFFVIIFISSFFIIFQHPIEVYFLNNNSTFSSYIIPLYLLSIFLYAQAYNYLRGRLKIFSMNVMAVSGTYLHIFFILLYVTYVDRININTLILSEGLAVFLVVLPAIILIYREIHPRFIVYKFSEIKEQVKLGFPLILNYIVDFILAASDRFILAYYMGAIAVGLYVPAYTLGSVILLVPKAIGTVVPQMMSKSLDDGNFMQAKNIFFNSMKIYGVLSIPFIFGIYLVSYDALLLLTNSQVAEKGQAIATIVAIGSFFYGLNIIITQANMVDLKTKIIFKANAIAAIVNVILNIAILHFIQNIYVPAITTLLSFFIATVYFYKELDPKWHDSRIIGLILKLFLISSLMLIIVSYCINYLPMISILYTLLIKIFFSIVVYVTLIFIFHIYSPQQIKEIKGLLKK